MNSYISIGDNDRKKFNKVVNHPLQSFEWGEFRKKIGTKVVRKALVDNEGNFIDGFTLTIHKIPFLPYNIGYVGKGNFPDKTTLEELKKIGEEEKCIYIQLEPNVTINEAKEKNIDLNNLKNFNIKQSFHPLFTKYTFVLDLDKSEDQILIGMHPKTRYNIRVATKHKVDVVNDNSIESFNKYLSLMEETTQRQRFYAHDRNYHKNLWEMLKDNKNKDDLIYKILLAYYQPEGKKREVLTAWVIFIFKDVIYYPYGASSRNYREVMASNLTAWEAIKIGKEMGMKRFDMWGALGENPDKSDPWYGFHRFKQGYGATLTEFIGSYDLIINPFLYYLVKRIDKIRWFLLSLRKRIRH